MPPSRGAPRREPPRLPARVEGPFAGAPRRTSTITTSTARRAPRLLPLARETSPIVTGRDAIALALVAYVLFHLVDLARLAGAAESLESLQRWLSEAFGAPAPLVASALYALVLVAIGARLRGRASLLGLRAGRGDLRFTIAVGGPLALLALAASWVAGARLARDGELSEAVAMLSVPVLDRPNGALLFALAMVVAAPLAEETLFRGVLYRALRERLSPPNAAIVQAALFAAWHIPWPGAADQLVPRPEIHILQYAFALLAAWTVERRATLAPAILLHAGGNGLALSLMMMATWRTETLLKAFGG